MSKLRHTGKPKDTWTRLKTRARLLDTGRCKASAACLEGRQDAKTRAEIQGRSRRRRRGGAAKGEGRRGPGHRDDGDKAAFINIMGPTERGVV